MIYLLIVLILFSFLIALLSVKILKQKEQIEFLKKINEQNVRYYENLLSDPDFYVCERLNLSVKKELEKQFLYGGADITKRKTAEGRSRFTERGQWE